MMKVIKQVERAKEINDSDVTLDYIDNELILYLIDGRETYQVSCVDGLWRCDCEDWVYHKDKHLGAYNCKHILKAIHTLMEDA